jgi:FtsP/CotA-like multicopper oxidase with cupredoxin domain
MGRVEVDVVTRGCGKRDWARPSGLDGESAGPSHASIERERHTRSRRLAIACWVVATLTVWGTGCGGGDGSGGGSPLRQPEVRASSEGTLSTTLRVAFAENQVGDQTVFTRTYEGSLPGPTLRVRPGDVMRIRLDNQLPPNPDQDQEVENVNRPHQPNTTNIHTHGMHVSPEGNSDNIFLRVQPGETFDYEFDIPQDHAGGLFWYHPHKHGAVYDQMRGGMAGAIIVAGPLDDVPEVRAAKDVLMVMQLLELNDDGEVEPSNPDATMIGDIFPSDQTLLTVNGQLLPTIRMRPGEVQRWRILNATSNLYMPIALDGHDLHILAKDGLTLSAVETTGEQLLAPANRIEVLVKAGEPGTYFLRKPEFGRVVGKVAPSEVEQELVQVVVEGEPLDMALPTTLPTQTRNIDADELTGSREVTFNVIPGDIPQFLMDGKSFDPNRVDYSIKLGDVEEWTVTNLYDGDIHPFHIHTNPFEVTHINGQKLETPIWSDTFNVSQSSSITFRIRFADFTGKMVDHCHIIEHEELGMMQVIEVSE